MPATRPNHPYLFDRNDCLALAHEASFTLDGIRYHSALHYLQAKKAQLFHDDHALKRIRACGTDVKTLIRLGKNIANFNDLLWKQEAYDLALRCNMAKFAEHQDLQDALIISDYRSLVFCDRNCFWGIGDSILSANVLPWNGENALGSVLEIIRGKLRASRLHPELVTDHLVLFWHPPSVFCQSTQSKFTVNGVTFCSMEQFMMAKKAEFFGDDLMLESIMQESDPAIIKSCGRNVANFDEQRWNEVASEFVYRGNLEKFSQNAELRKQLLDTGDKQLAEASPTDTIWGIGMSLLHPNVLDSAKWPGDNQLGKALMKVRDALRPPPPPPQQQLPPHRSRNTFSKSMSRLRRPKSLEPDNSRRKVAKKTNKK